MSVRVEVDAEGWVRCTLDRGRGNILDLATVQELTDALEALDRPRALILAAAGDDFGFGASIEDHAAPRIETALHAFATLLRRLTAVPAPTVAAVQGRCLGGSLELALACDTVVAATAATFGCPEIRLGVFPPFAAVLLPPRIGTGRASELMLSGRSIDLTTALQWGLVQRGDDDLAGAVDVWLQEAVRGRSRAGLAHAALAARTGLRHRLERQVPVQLLRYLDGLCRTPEGFEGIDAFLAGRDPEWP